MTRLEAMMMLVEHHLKDNDQLGEAARTLVIKVSLMGRLTDGIERLVSASIDASWKGGGDPEDIPVIEAELQEAREDMDKILAEVFTTET